MSFDRNKAILFCDRAVAFCLYGLVFALSFTEAGTEVFAWYAFFFWLLKRALGYGTTGPRHWLPQTPLNRALGLLVVANILSIFFSSYPIVSLAGFFSKILKFMAIYVAAAETINTRERLRNVLIAMVFSMVLVASDAIVQYFIGFDFIRQHGSYRLTASFKSPNSFAGWLIAIIVLFWLPISMGKKIFSYKKASALLIALLFLLIVFLLLTYTRAGWAGISLSLILAFLYFFIRPTRSKKALFLLIPVGMIIGYVFLPESIIERGKVFRNPSFSSGVSSLERIKAGRNMDRRIHLWREAVRIIRDYPVVGCGLNTYAKVARQYKSFKRGGVYPHNSFLQMAAETGLFGLFSFLWVLVIFFKAGFRHLRRTKDYFLGGCLFALLAFLVHAFFDVHLYSLRLAIFFWFLLGLTVAAMKIREGDRGQACSEDPQ